MPTTKEKRSLSVSSVIGTGDPSDRIMLIPLISQWKVPRNCLWNMTGEECDASLIRLYVLDEPLDGHKTDTRRLAFVKSITKCLVVHDAHT